MGFLGSMCDTVLDVRQAKMKGERTAKPKAGKETKLKSDQEVKLKTEQNKRSI